MTRRTMLLQWRVLALCAVLFSLIVGGMAQEAIRVHAGEKPSTSPDVVAGRRQYVPYVQHVSQNSEADGIPVPTPTPRPSPTPPPTVPVLEWEEVRNAPLARYEAQGVAVGGKLYLIGGFYTDNAATQRVDVYDPVTNNWKRLRDMPEALTHAPVVADGQSIYVIGGFRGDHPGPSTNQVWKYDISTDQWSAAPDLPEPLGASAAVRVGRTLHVFGGAFRPSGSSQYYDRDAHYVLNLDTGTAWQAAPPLPTPRNHLAGVALNDKIYAIGGQRGEDERDGNQSVVEIFDPVTGRWTTGTSLPEPRGHISSSAFVYAGRMYVVGGTVNGGTYGQSSDQVLVFDPSNARWSRTTPLPEGRKSPIADVTGQHIVVATGNGGSPNTSSTTWLSQPLP